MLPAIAARLPRIKNTINWILMDKNSGIRAVNRIITMLLEKQKLLLVFSTPANLITPSLCVS